MKRISRRTLLKRTAASLAATSMGGPFIGSLAAAKARPQDEIGPRLDLRFAVKIGMIGIDAPLVEKFELLRELGFDGIELDSPNNLNTDDVLRARDESGLPIHGVVDSIHWQQRLSSPDPSIRVKGRAGLEKAIRDSKAYGGSSVLLVPGRVADPQNENHDQVWERSIEEIRKVLPLAAELGIRILIENVWNGFCYDHEGSDDQSADQLAAYIDEIASPWVGAYFDIGNHRKYGHVEDWIRTLAHRIVKLDVKDWGKADGWSKIGEGDVNWPEVRRALHQIGFTGWCTAEVGGGGEERLAEIKERMDRVLRSSL